MIDCLLMFCRLLVDFLLPTWVSRAPQAAIPATALGQNLAAKWGASLQIQSREFLGKVHAGMVDIEKSKFYENLQTNVTKIDCLIEKSISRLKKRLRNKEKTRGNIAKRDGFFFC